MPKQIKTKPSCWFVKFSAQVQKLCRVEPQKIDWVPGLYCESFHVPALGLFVHLREKDGRQIDLALNSDTAVIYYETRGLVFDLVDLAKKFNERTVWMSSCGVPAKSAHALWRQFRYYNYLPHEFLN